MKNLSKKAITGLKKLWIFILEDKYSLSQALLIAGMSLIFSGLIVLIFGFPQKSV